VATDTVTHSVDGTSTSSPGEHSSPRWEPGDPLYGDPRHDYTESGPDRQTVRKFFEVLIDHTDRCAFCTGAISKTRKAMVVTFEKDYREVAA